MGKQTGGLVVVQRVVERVNERVGDVSVGVISGHADVQMEKLEGRLSCRWKNRKSALLMCERVDGTDGWRAGEVLEARANWWAAWLADECVRV